MPNPVNYGDIPHVVYGGMTDYKRLFYSDPDDALVIPITLRQGFGVIPAGCMIAKNASGTNDYEWVPWQPDYPDQTSGHVGQTFVLADPNGGSTVDMLLDDSYKFNVDDDICFIDTDGTGDQGDAITAIDRATYTNKAVITFTTAANVAQDVAKYAVAFLETDTSAHYTKAAAILMHTVDTGVGVNAKGAQGVAILSNAVLYKGLLTNYLSGASPASTTVLTDFGATFAVEHGQFLLLK